MIIILEHQPSNIGKLAIDTHYNSEFKKKKRYNLFLLDFKTIYSTHFYTRLLWNIFWMSNWKKRILTMKTRQTIQRGNEKPMLCANLYFLILLTGGRWPIITLNSTLSLHSRTIQHVMLKCKTSKTRKRQRRAYWFGGFTNVFFLIITVRILYQETLALKSYIYVYKYKTKSYLYHFCNYYGRLKHMLLERWTLQEQNPVNVIKIF